MKRLKLLTESIDLTGVGQIDFTWDFDNDDYQEWLNDNNYKNDESSLQEYIEKCVEFDLEYFDNDTFHHMSYDTCSYDEIESEFGEKFAKRVVSEIINDGMSSIETTEIHNDQNFNINNSEELDDIAMKMFNYGSYYKDCRGYILSNGVIIYTPLEHNMVSKINGIDGTFDFIKLGNIRILSQSIDLSRKPTKEQKNTLRVVISNYSDSVLYLDIMTDNGTISCQYNHPDWRRVIADIDRYFDDGIRPQEVNIHESKEINGLKLTGECDNLSLVNANYSKQYATYHYSDSTAYPFIIFNNKLYIGRKKWTHYELAATIKKNNVTKENGIFGRIWVSAKINDFNYAVVAFWGSRNNAINCKSFIEELATKLKVNKNKIIIALGDSDGEKDMIPFNEWNGIIHEATPQEDKRRNLHMMSAQDKYNNTKDFRDTRDKKNGEKLSLKNGDEMTMAQYHSLLYQESKKIFITEEQYIRIFKENNH